MKLDDVPPASASSERGEGSSFDPALWAISDGFTAESRELETSGLQAAYLNGKSPLLYKTVQIMSTGHANSHG